MTDDAWVPKSFTQHQDEMQWEIARLRQPLTEPEASYQAEIDRLREKLQIARTSERAALAAEAGRVTPVIASWEQMRQAVARIPGLEAEIARLQSLNTMLGANVDALDAEVGRLREERDAGRREVILANEAGKMGTAIALIPTLKAERDTLAARLAAAEQVVEAAREVPTDHAFGIIADLTVDAAYADKWAWYQSVLDDLQAFDAVVDAYQSTQAETTDG